MKSVIALFAIAVFSFTVLFDKEITGVVLDERGPLPFANVVLKGTTIGTTTDLDGKFKLAIPEEKLKSSLVVVVTYTGYTTEEVEVKNFDQPIEITLEPSVSLESVVVTSASKSSSPGLFNKKSKSKGSSAPMPTPKPSSPTAATMPTRDVSSTISTTAGVMVLKDEIYTLSTEKESRKKNRGDRAVAKAEKKERRSEMEVEFKIKREEAAEKEAMAKAEKEMGRVDAEEEMAVSGDMGLGEDRLMEAPELKEPVFDKAPPRDPQPEELTIDDAQAKTLTAGEINDFSKWDMWNDLSADELAGYAQKWKIEPKNRYSVKVRTENGAPAINKKVDLLAKDGSLLWSTYTDNTGRAELWQSMYGDEAVAQKLVVHYKGGSSPLKNIKEFKSGINSIELPVECNNVDPEIDIAFVVDATGSMADEISYLKAELKDVIGQVKEALPKSTMRTGSVFYRDHGEEYVTRKSDFSNDISTTVGFIANQYARGGGDFPEAVDDALRVALSELSWSKTSTSKILFLILDAPPHGSKESIARIQAATKLAAAQGIRIIPITCSGIRKGTEYLMRSLALATNGTYTFLTDDSGVGGAHLEPSTDLYNVELLNYQMIRLITQFSEIKECEEDYSQTIIDINEQNNQSNLIWEYYPNPTQGMFSVKAEKPMEEILIADMNGKLLMRKAPNAMTERFDISDLPSGVYIIRVHFDENTWETGRIVLVHNH